MGWVANLLNRAMAVQYDVLYDFPEEKRKAGYGRAARLIIEGPEGGVFDLWFCEKGVKPKPEEVKIKNIVRMSEETLLNLITPDISVDKLAEAVANQKIEDAVTQLYPRLRFSTALANELISVSGDNPDVSSEEWTTILDRVILKVAFPVVIKGMLLKQEEIKNAPTDKRV